MRDMITSNCACRTLCTSLLRITPDTHSLHSGYANLAFGEGSEPVPMSKEKKKRPSDDGRGTRVFVLSTKIFRFATGEQAPRWLSLKCEPIPCEARSWARSRGSQTKTKRTPIGVLLFFGSGTRIRTQTYRVRVCCATFTQFRYCFNARLF